MNKLKHFRLLNGATQKILAKAAGVQQSTYQRWETGAIEIPQERLEKLADFYGVSSKRLVGKPVSTEEWIKEAKHDSSRYFGELSIHFKSNNEPLLFSVDTKTANSVFTSLENGGSFCSFKTLSNHLVFLRLSSVSDICVHQEALEDFGPEHERYNTQYIGLPNDSSELEIISFLCDEECIDDDIDRELINQVKRKLFNLLEGGYYSIDPELDDDFKNIDDDYFCEKASDIVELTKNLQIQFSNGVKRTEDLSLQDASDLYPVFSMMFSEDNVAEDGQFLIWRFESGFKYSCVNTSSIDYIIVPAHIYESAKVEYLEEMESSPII